MTEETRINMDLYIRKIIHNSIPKKSNDGAFYIRASDKEYCQVIYGSTESIVSALRDSISDNINVRNMLFNSVLLYFIDHPEEIKKFQMAIREIQSVPFS